MMPDHILMQYHPAPGNGGLGLADGDADALALGAADALALGLGDELGDGLGDGLGLGDCEQQQWSSYTGAPSPFTSANVWPLCDMVHGWLIRPQHVPDCTHWITPLIAVRNHTLEVLGSGGLMRGMNWSSYRY